VKSLQKKIENISSENKDQAVTNISLEPELEHLREELVRLATQQNELKEKYTQMTRQISKRLLFDILTLIFYIALCPVGSTIP